MKTDLACPSVVLGFYAAVAQCEPTLRVQGVDGKRSLPVLCRLQQAQAQALGYRVLVASLLRRLQQAQAQSSPGSGLLPRAAFQLTRDGHRHRHKAQAARDGWQVRHSSALQTAAGTGTRFQMPLHGPTSGAFRVYGPLQVTSLAQQCHSRGQRCVSPQRTSAGGGQSVRGSAAPLRCGAPTSPRLCGSERPPESGRPGSTRGEHRRA